MKVKELYNKNYRTPKKEIEEDTRRWKNLPCSWIDRINIVKITMPLKATAESMQLPSKSQSHSL
jgi:hypothetical protein